MENKTLSVYDVKYSTEFGRLAAVVSINGIVVKDRYGDGILKAMNDEETVAIQNGDKITIHCRKDFTPIFKRIINDLTAQCGEGFNNVQIIEYENKF